jgi:hypothetical protein
MKMERRKRERKGGDRENVTGREREKWTEG